MSGEGWQFDDADGAAVVVSVEGRYMYHVLWYDRRELVVAVATAAPPSPSPRRPVRVGFLSMLDLTPGPADWKLESLWDLATRELWSGTGT